MQHVDGGGGQNDTILKEQSNIKELKVGKKIR